MASHDERCAVDHVAVTRRPTRKTATFNVSKSNKTKSPSFLFASSTASPYLALLFTICCLLTTRAASSSSSSSSIDSHQDNKDTPDDQRHHPHHHQHNHDPHHRQHHNYHAHHHQEKPSSPPRVSLGIADASATAGRLFEYSIPPHAFSGDVASFRATEAGLAALPNWLGFKSETGLFYGVPSEDDVGQTYVSVTAIGHNRGESVSSNDGDKDAFVSNFGAKDVFSITVNKKTPRLTATPFGQSARLSSTEESKECGPEEPSTIASVVVDRAFADMEVEEKIRLLEKFGEFVKVS